MITLIASLLACRIINGSLLVFNIIVHIFYTFCLIFPPAAGQRKQPLTLFLGFLILCCLSYCVFLVIEGLYGLFEKRTAIVPLLINYSVDYSMVSYVWLNFYYFIQIVPAPFALFRWVKRNIKSTICVLLGIDILITILSRIHTYVLYLIILYCPGFPLNATGVPEFEQTRMFSFYTIMAHYIVMLCVTVVSSFSTARYLHKHIQRMGKMSTSISGTRLRGQMRIATIGIFQGVFFFLYASLLLLGGFTVEKAEFWLDSNIWLALTTVFITGTTVTLGIGQTVFRQRIVKMYKALKRVRILWS